MASSRVTIRYQDKSIECRNGISIAVALWENGIKVLSHSPKYGRPRGVKCGRGHCTNCLMRVNGEPNIRTCHTEVSDGMIIETQDSNTPLNSLMQKSLSKMSHKIPNGFYYKWFTKPALLSKAFINGIRPMTGVGKIGIVTKHSKQLKSFEQFDNIVIGGGEPGMNSALELSGSVLLIDDHKQLGGHRYSALKQVEHLETPDELCQRVIDAENITVFENYSAVAGYRPDTLLLKAGSQLHVVKSNNIVWRAGSLDKIGLFENNDLPGIMGARGMYRLAADQNMKVQGIKTVVSGHGRDFWLSALFLAKRGAHVTAIFDGNDSDYTDVPGINIQQGSSPVRALAEDGCLSAIEFEGKIVECELCVIAGHKKPAYDIPYQLGRKLVLDPSQGGFIVEDK